MLWIKSNAKKHWFLLFQLSLDLDLPSISYLVKFSRAIRLWVFVILLAERVNLFLSFMKTFLSLMFYRISQHSTFLYLMNPKFTKVGIIEDQLIDSIYPAGTIYQKLGHRDGAFFSDSKMRTSFHPRLQQCLDGISVQEWYFYHRHLRLMNSYWTRSFLFHWMKWVMIYENIIKSVWIRMK